MADGKSESDQPHYHEHRTRLRQRFRETADPLPDYELLELLLFHAIPRRDVKPLAKRLIKEFGGFGRVLAAPRAELTKAGLGDTTIDLLKATHESSARLLRGEAEDRDVLSSGQKVIDFCRAKLAHADVEEFHLLFLDRKNRLIRAEKQQRGTVDHTPVYPREVVKRALELSATAIILVHNHPSGDPSPSKADIEMTREIARAASTLGIAVHDHIIVGRQGHTSLKSMGVI
ncbi:MAG TPA: DNA repair protein RadC [Alphaproteobacteria bacterium]